MNRKISNIKINFRIFLYSRTIITLLTKIILSSIDINKEKILLKITNGWHIFVNILAFKSYNF